jgi:ATP-dependent RNA helicase HelY
MWTLTDRHHLTVDQFRERAGYDFALDRFQIQAIETYRAGRSVLVAAPTGSGKTVVAEYAVEAALAGEGKAFYTAPIKALSNQKYRDLIDRHGPDQVGLLTGDNSINGDAPVVVMTTEVLRNMIYARSSSLDDLHAVVLDEVHYLQDAYRGPVWEEVIVHLALNVQLVCLSATVSNAGELGEWLETVRGPTDVVIETQRPVELENLYLVGERGSEVLHLLPTLVEGKPNREGSRFDAADRGFRGRGRPRRRWFTPDRIDTVELLQDRSMLPAIYFIFSRAGCDDAAARCRDGAIRLTDPDERDEIRRQVEARVEALSDDELAVFDYAAFLSTLQSGYAAHHAGMIPPFKEAVEQCFVRGLVKVVFATETLALGINMPARTVVIDKLSKFTGDGHEVLTPGEYTQITGRAGRRGIDEHGYALVAWSPFVPFAQVASLASSREFVLRSAFRPTYNMAANLVRDHEPEEAHRLLNASFAQFQADREVVELQARAERLRADRDQLAAAAVCSRGDLAEYCALAEKSRGQRGTRSEIEGALARAKPGDVLIVPPKRAPAAVISVAQRRGATRIRAVTAAGDLVTRGPADFADPPERVAGVTLPTPFAPNSKRFRREVAERVRDLVLDEPRRPPREPTPLEEHPVHTCPDRDAHLKVSRRLERVSRQVADLDARIASRADSLALRFDRVLQLLEQWGHLDGWKLTDRGSLLAAIYHESDLLVAEAISDGLFEGLDGPECAALVSCLTYEHRSATPAPPPSLPTRKLRDRWQALEGLAHDLWASEEAAGLTLTREPDPGLADVIHGWAAGHDIEDVLGDDDLTGGDFVRNVKQVADLLRQVGEVTTGPTAAAARQGTTALLRGVVAASSSVGA